MTEPLRRWFARIYNHSIAPENGIGTKHKSNSRIDEQYHETNMVDY